MDLGLDRQNLAGAMVYNSNGYVSVSICMYVYVCTYTRKDVSYTVRW